MQFEKVNCLVRVIQDGDINTLSVGLSGPDAVAVTEIPILRAINDIQGGGEEGCSVTRVSVAGSFESSGGNELNRLRMKYGPEVVAAMYPGGRGLPKVLADCELPSESLAKAKSKAKAE